MRLWWPESSEEARRWHAARGGIARGDLGLPREGLRACGGGLWKWIRGRRQSVARSSGGGTALVTGSGGECAREVCLDLVKLFGGSSCTDSARMKEFTARVSTAAFAAAASGVPSELRATCMGKSGV